MMTTRLLAAAIAAGLLLGCTKESSRGPVQWTASNPSSAVGQTAAQAWSRSTANDTPERAREPHLNPSLVRASAAQPSGVTNAQPPTPRWPYDGVTLQLGPAEPRPVEP
jgi:hypothetical protein